MNAAQGNHWVNGITTVCLCSIASVTPMWVVLETAIFLQNACRTTHGISSVGSPVCQLAGGHLEMTLHECHVPCLKWKSPCVRCVRAKPERSPPYLHSGMDPCLLIPPLKVLGICPNFLCRNCCTANRRQNCVIVVIAYTCWTPSHIQSLFLSLM